MPKLSRYLQREDERQATAPAASPHPAVLTMSAADAAALTERFKQQHAKRIQTWGPRLFRHPDGQLRDSKPPANPYAAVLASLICQLRSG